MNVSHNVERKNSSLPPPSNTLIIILFKKTKVSSYKGERKALLPREGKADNWKGENGRVKEKVGKYHLRRSVQAGGGKRRKLISVFSFLSSLASNPLSNLGEWGESTDLSSLFPFSLFLPKKSPAAQGGLCFPPPSLHAPTPSPFFPR